MKGRFTLEKLFMTAVLAGLLLLPAAGRVSAKTLEKYRADIEHLKKKAATLLYKETTEEFREEVYAEIPKLFPPEDKIEHEGVTMDVDNSWLHGEFKRYREKTDSSEKRYILTAVYERLEAIGYRIEEFEAAAAAGADKDEQKRKLAEILRREEFQKPADEESLLEKILNWIQDMLNRSVPPQRPQHLPASNFGGFARVLQILLFAVLLLILGFLILKFGPLLLGKIRARERNAKKEKIILGERIGADSSSADLFSEAEKLALEGNLRDAIRKGYIAFLFELSERKLIGLAKHKTNRDYLRAVSRKRELYGNMSGLTSNYERHWYGFEDTSEEDWEEFKADYREALGKAN